MITMTLGWGTIAAVAAWSALVFWLGRRSAGSVRVDLSGPPYEGAAMPTTPAKPTVPSPAALPPEHLAAIRHELARGNKIDAIKLMREATGLGLAEAKQAVEAMED